MITQAFLDECKRGGYTVAVVVVPMSEVTKVRTAMRALLLPGERSLHFNSERDGRRRNVLSAICDTGVSAILYQADRRTELDARLAIIDRVVTDGVALGATRIVIERDDSTYIHDIRQAKISRSKANAEHSLDFEALRRTDEPVLWIPDAIAWSWTKGGEWRQRIESIVTEQIDV